MARILDWGMVCDRGRTRAENQDATLLWVPGVMTILPATESAAAPEQPVVFPDTAHAEAVPAQCCAVIADGMGGARGGEEASRLIVRAAAQRLPQIREQDVLAGLSDFLGRVNDEVFEHARHRDLVGMGSTCTILCVVGDHAYLGHVGDSRCYLMRSSERAVWQWSEDQNLANQLVRQGVLAPELALRHHSSHVLTQAIGLGKPVEPQLSERELTADDQIILLTSDGLLRVVTERDIEQAIEFYLDRPDPVGAGRQFLQRVAEELLALANERGSPDNVSIILLGIGGAEGR
jgi:PPM family protein phosphatase